MDYDADEILARMRADEESDWPERLLGGLAVVRPRSRDLSLQERRALELASRGLETREVAEVMFLSAQTVKSHLKAARYRLRAKNTTHACCEAIRQGLIP